MLVRPLGSDVSLVGTRWIGDAGYLDIGWAGYVPVDIMDQTRAVAASGKELI